LGNEISPDEIKILAGGGLSKELRNLAWVRWDDLFLSDFPVFIAKNKRRVDIFLTFLGVWFFRAFADFPLR
jgi:hypothetical protein